MSPATSTEGRPTLAARPASLPRLLPPASATLNLAGHLARYGNLPPVAPGLIAVVERSGLRGRGGAGFPTARKLAAVTAETHGRPGRAVVVANGAEGEPASGKDRTLLALSPHLVLDGVAVAVAALGATEAFVCVDEGARAAQRALAAALAERTDAVAVRLVTVPSRYVAGEETALVNWLNGGAAKPTFVPPRPFQRGVHGRPTLIDNVETLAHLALIARYGDDWFRSVGSDAVAGSMLVTVSGAVPRPGVLEAAPGTGLGELVAAAGGPSEALSAVLLGGCFGTWMEPTAAWGRNLDLTVGAGIVVAFPASACGLAEVARLARWLAGQSAGQCGPCVNGLPAIADGVDALMRGRASAEVVANLKRRLALVPGRGACHLPDGATRVVASGLNLFSAEIQAHAAGRCTATRRGPVLPFPVG
ncbi:MAG TPA: NADH-ubiquinone oxidoreductase-F iron-sulfur binding region domain-containing protein [Acidimicrobiales bacterium]|jgi:NADH:ubiquinone oxidoreductase subunit F (NADH-binding)|nr:NADH-ubiquinone oxidoreductase-F iron-sulfur binding region domain-containing protein [Acidimicrobiales bacterium]